MTGPRAITPAREPEFTRDWNDGMLLRLMAQKYQCTPATIASTVHRLGLAARYRRRDERLVYTDPEVALAGGRWVANGRGTMVWGAA